ncbi:MAG TPA: glycosyltransferase family 39 protein [Acidobacteriaceae bacterium]|jgi:4-amino-4-deoxy-L-arabinose transferase-like glycosyltransferase|nr:glycosyltransferase family 39 protein [Acidobacteriaceae bacterium]
MVYQKSSTGEGVYRGSGYPIRAWNPRSIGLIVLAWLVLHIGGLVTSVGLLDDVDSVYLEIAREMLLRHNFVTPFVDGIRFFDKPPLMYWLAAGSMYIFGPHDWAGRLPLALLTLGLLLATYALALRLFAVATPATHPDRAALYSALALATCVGPYLYTRFYIPDIAVALWLTLSIHAFLAALDRIQQRGSALLPCLAFASVTALNILTKGLIGLVFPVAFAFLYLAFTRQLRLLPKFHLVSSTLLFLAIALPWHILAARETPPIALPAGLGLPARGGWAWFYLYNEHIARFLSRRIPHDYGQVPIPLFWLLTAIWIFPWSAFLPAALRQHVLALRTRAPQIARAETGLLRPREAALTLLLWAALVLGFFTLSARQEYYSLPALPALALMAGGALAVAERRTARQTRRSTLAWHKWMLVPFCTVCAAVALFFAVTAPHVDASTDISDLLNQGGDYNLSLGHLFDLTGRAMGFFRPPLVLFGLSMLAIGPLTYLLRRRDRFFAANISLATAAMFLLLAVHEGLVRFYPTLGSKQLSESILDAQRAAPRPNDLILIDGELTAGSTLLFYTQQPVHLVNGRMNGPWYGSFWPDAPQIFETDNSLRRLWPGPRRLFLLTYHPEDRVPDLSRFGQVHVLASIGGKSVLTNQP